MVRENEVFFHIRLATIESTQITAETDKKEPEDRSVTLIRSTGPNHRVDS
jgi:hypothetical protein